MTRFVVVYDDGAVDPAEIHTGLAPLGDVVYALAPSPHNERLAPLLRELGTVVPLDPRTMVADVGRLRPDAVLTFSERRLRLAAALTSALSLPGHLPTVAETLTDKLRQRAALSAAGVDHVRHAAVRPGAADQALAVVGLPAVLKPVVGEGSRDTLLLDDPATATTTIEATLAATGADFVLEERLVGRDSGRYGDFVSVESVIADGRIGHLGVTGKFPLLPPFREQGQFWPARLDPVERAALTELAARAITALGVHTGITHTEIKLTPDGPRIIEVNGRLGGFINDLSIRSAGIDAVGLAGRVALGERVAVAPVAPTAVHFHYQGQSPTRRCRLVGVNGLAQVRRVAGVTGYRRMIPLGTELADSVMTRPVGVVYGTAADHAGMLAVLDRALAELTYRYDIDGTIIDVPGDADWPRPDLRRP
ncbi:ATP-grasp domain-containing protein [Catellatospora tritici]|uniref:ATP-grasp domain-containing protein n=1 Tax=Catellatospora tritici TaxID=2851566 RepID=UPI001C2DDA9B|nr:hypothetical protein [Catellatospora tritici]MBV1850610.1 hypothetical protein [Catellatospora tritici]